MEDIETDRKPDLLDLIVILKTYAKEVNKTGELQELLGYTGEGKIFRINGQNIVIYPIFTGEEAKEVSETILKAQKFIIEFNKWISNPQTGESNKITILRSGFGKNCIAGLYGHNSTSIHVSGVPQDFENNMENNMKFAAILSEVFEFGVQYENIQRGKGKLLSKKQMHFYLLRFVIFYSIKC